MIDEPIHVMVFFVHSSSISFILGGNMKKILASFIILCFSAACSTTSYKPVASLEDLSPKENIETRRNWIEPNSDAKTGAAFVSGFMGGLLIGLPLALVIASIPDERDITMTELADKVAAKTCDRDTNKFILYASGLSEELVVMGLNIDDNDDTGLRPIGLMYIAKEGEDRRAYSEARLVKKINENTYWSWRIPLLKKTDTGNLVYVLNDKLRLDGPITRKGGDDMLEFTFVDDSAGGAKVTRCEKDLLQDIKTHFMGNSFGMEPMKCALGDKDCGGQATPPSAGEQATSTDQFGVN